LHGQFKRNVIFIDLNQLIGAIDNDGRCHCGSERVIYGKPCIDGMAYKLLSPSTSWTAFTDGALQRQVDI